MTVDTAVALVTERPDRLENEVCKCGGDRVGFMYYEARDMWVCYNCWKPVITNHQYVPECISCGNTFVLRIFNNGNGIGICGDCQ